MRNRVYNKPPRFTTKRGNVYYINFRLPDGTFFRRSLGTDSLQAVEVTMSRLSAYIPLVQSGSLSIEQFKMHIDGFREATQRDFDTYLLDWLQMGVEEAKRMPELGRWQRQIDPESAICPTASVEQAKGYADVFMNRMYSGDDLTARMLLATLFKKKVSVDQSGIEQAYEVAGQIDFHQAMLYQAYEAFYSGDLVRYRTLVDEMQLKLTEAEQLKKPAAKKVSPFEPESKDTPLLSTAWKMFTTEKGKGWAAAVANENQRFYDVLMHVIGDLPVGVITKQHIRQTLGVIANLPRRNKKPYSEMTLAECDDLDVPEEDLLSSANVKKHLKIFSSFFNVFLKNEKDILEKAPTEGIKYEVTENRRGLYSKSEILRLISSLKSYSDWRRDYFFTLVYTGARRGEIAAIRKEHIRKDGETGRWYIFIEDGKTKHARRRIPIHSALEELLLSRTEPLNPADLVFGDLPTYEQIGLEWHDIMQKSNVPKLSEFGKMRKIHSLRHTFVSEAMSKTLHPIVQICVGHAITKTLGITGVYTHPETMSLEKLLPAVDCIDW